MAFVQNVDGQRPFLTVTSCKGELIIAEPLALPSLRPFAFGLLSYFSRAKSMKTPLVI